MYFMSVVMVSAAMLGVLISSAGFAAEETRVRWLDLNQMQKIIEEQAPVIVDLRTPREFEQGHIPGAVNVPVDDFKSEPRLARCV